MVELTIEVDGDRFVEGVLRSQAREAILDAVARAVEDEVARQTEARVARFADDTDRDLEYAPEARVRVSHHT